MYSKLNWKTLVLAMLIGTMLMLNACAMPTPEVIQETIMVEGTPQVVEKVVTATPEPTEAWLTLSSVWEVPPAYHGSPFASGGVGPAWWWVFEPFFHYVPVSEDILPRLAESYEETDEGFTVHLAKGVVWHDGEPFTSKDVWCTFMLRKLFNASIWNYIDDVEIVDDFTVFFPWKERTRFAKQFFAVEPIYAPYHLFGEWADQVADVMDDPDAQQELIADLQEFRPEKPTGTGPFQVDTVTASDLIMTKFEDYRLASNVAFEGVKYLQAGRHEVGMAYSLAGETHDCGAPLRPDYAEALAARRPDLRVIAVTDLSEFGTTYNIRNDPFSDHAVREALTYATDRLQLAQATLPAGNPVTQYSHQVLKSLQDFWLSEDVRDSMTKRDYNPDKAVELLTEAGFSQDADGMWTLPDGSPWEIEINCPAGYGDWVLGCENLAAQWTDFGIPSVCQPIENAVWWPSATAGEFDVGFLWAGVHWSTAHPYTAMQRHFLGDGGQRSGLADMLEDLTGRDGEPIDVEALITELGTSGEIERQKEIVGELAWVANEVLSQMVYVEKQFHFCLYEDEIAGFPATDDSLWLLAPGGQERVWVWLMINNIITPK